MVSIWTELVAKAGGAKKHNNNGRMEKYLE